MTFGSSFQRLADNQTNVTSKRPAGHGWLGHAQDSLDARFRELTGHGVQVLALGPGGAPNEAGGAHVASIPACEAVCSEEGRRAGWAAHLSELRDSPITHWHVCKHGNSCAVVPLVVAGQCVGVCRLVCDDRTDRRVFEQHVKLLNVLVNEYVSENGSVMSGGVAKQAGDGEVSRPDMGEQEDVIARVPPESHPAVRAAADHIEQNLGDPGLTVGAIAKTLGMNSTYLGHLFVKEVGLPMHRHIIHLRIRMAKRLLSTTDWQVKRIAYAIGHRNADWFSHVFRRETGITPREFRRSTREP